MRSYDLIVIGAGPAGEKGAALAAQFGKSVALVQSEVVPGGACVNTGTIPSKTLRESALHLSGFKQRGLHGVSMAMGGDITVSDFLQRKREVCEKEWDLIEENLRWHGIERYRGIGRFVSPHEIVVDTSGHDITLHGEVILIATGSSPFRAPHIPFDDECIYDSDTVLDLDRIPKTMAVVGAGVIGCEYASIFAALGIKVTLIDGRTELLSNVDREIVDVLLREMKNRLRINMQLGNNVDNIDVGKDCVALKLSNGRMINAEKVLFAGGRQSNTADLNLEGVGVQMGERGIIPVNEWYQTNVPNIYAAGDVIGFPALASTSMEQARVAAVNAFNLPYETELVKQWPYGIYTIPEMSMIGQTEEDCLKAGIDYEVGRAYYRNNARGQIIGDTAGMLKLVFNPEDRKLLGIHIVGESASELIHTGMMVMQLNGTIDIFVQTVFNYPTLGDIYKHAADDGLSRIARRRKQQQAILNEADTFEASLAARINGKNGKDKNGASTIGIGAVGSTPGASTPDASTPEGNGSNGSTPDEHCAFAGLADAGALQVDAPVLRADE